MKKNNRRQLKLKVQKSHFKPHISKNKLLKKWNLQLSKKHKNLKNNNKKLMMYINIVVQTICQQVYQLQVRDYKSCQNKTRKTMKNNFKISEINKSKSLEKLMKLKVRPVKSINKSNPLKLLTQSFLFQLLSVVT